MFDFPFHIWEKSAQLTNIFQDGYCTTNSREVPASPASPSNSCTKCCFATFGFPMNTNIVRIDLTRFDWIAKVTRE
jgi:hypothetical protein